MTHPDGFCVGYHASENLFDYAVYLDAQIQPFLDLKHDSIRVQSGNNRDMRNSAAIEDGTVRRRGGAPTERRKTILLGRKLNVECVSLLSLPKTSRLILSQLYLDNLEDQSNIMALRMLVKELLILFQASNEGVISVLGEYVDQHTVLHINATILKCPRWMPAKRSDLRLYRNFCKQTERVAKFLDVTKKLQNLLTVPIPDPQHVRSSFIFVKLTRRNRHRCPSLRVPEQPALRAEPSRVQVGQGSPREGVSERGRRPLSDGFTTLHERVKVINRGSTTGVSTRNLTFHRSIDILPMYCHAKLLSVVIQPCSYCISRKYQFG